jgi:hypothetical protein
MAAYSGTALIRETTLSFDGGDPQNGSLYLSTPPGADEAARAAVEALRAAGLWSADPAKQVKDEQREAYATQMRFVEAVEVRVGGRPVVLARYDHPKFPSSAARFAAWQAALAGK